MGGGQRGGDWRWSTVRRRRSRLFLLFDGGWGVVRQEGLKGHSRSLKVLYLLVRRQVLWCRWLPWQQNCVYVLFFQRQEDVLLSSITETNRQGQPQNRNTKGKLCP